MTTVAPKAARPAVKPMPAQAGKPAPKAASEPAPKATPKPADAMAVRRPAPVPAPAPPAPKPNHRRELVNQIAHTAAGLGGVAALASPCALFVGMLGNSAELVAGGLAALVLGGLVYGIGSAVAYFTKPR